MVILPTSERAAEYKWLADKCLALKSFGTKVIEDNGVTILCKYTPTQATLIDITSGGFICHPRTGNFASQPIYNLDGTIIPVQSVQAGGWQQTGSGLVQYPSADNVIYPIIDEDKSSATVTKDEIEFLGNNSAYGNLYWSNEDASIVLSWKGSPHRYYRIPDTINIPTLSHYFSGRSAMTVFGPNVYKDGKVYASVPDSSPSAMYVMGASQIGKTVYVVALLDTEHSFETVVLSTNTPSSIVEGCNWKELGRKNVGRSELPWFPNTKGTTFTSVTGDTVSIKDDTAIFTVVEKSSLLGSFSAENTGTKRRFPTILDLLLLKGLNFSVQGTHYWESITFRQNFSGTVIHDNNGSISLSLSSVSHSPPVNQGHTARAKNIEAKPLSPGLFQISGPYEWTGSNTGDYTYAHNAGDVTWSWPDKNCDMQVVRAEDSCGRTAELQVRGTGGVWVHDDSIIPAEAAGFGWSVDEWHYFGPWLRVKLLSINSLGVKYMDVLADCSPSVCFDPRNMDNPAARYIIEYVDSGWHHCTGDPSGYWWSGTTDKRYNACFEDGGGDPYVYCGHPWKGYGSGGLGDWQVHGDYLHGWSDYMPYVWKKMVRMATVTEAVLWGEKLVCP